MVHINCYFNRSFKGLALKLFIILYITGIILSPTFRINETNIYNKAFPRKSSSELFILSPENRTYTERMAGYYPSSYGFENYKNGTIGLDIRFLNEYYSPIPELNTDIRIIEDELDGHRNYLNIRDSQQENNTWAVHYIENPQSIGTIEFFNRFNNILDGSPIRRQYLYFRASNDTIAFRMQINHHNGDLKYYNGFSYELIANVNADTWYHHKIVFDCNNGTKGTFKWIISEENNPEKYSVRDIDFENNFTGSTIDEICFETQEEDFKSVTMWDAFGFSWDPNYIVGANLWEGLLLSFINTTNLNWIGFSLNGETNRTILGNTTISLEGNGKYSIQIFGTDLNGNIYQSDVRYFSYDPSYSETDKPDIPIIPFIIILSVVGVSIPSSYMIINYEKKKRIKKEIDYKKGVKIIKTLKNSFIKDLSKKEKLKVLDVKNFDKKLSPIPQKIPIDKDSNDFVINDLEEYNLESLRELCNEWINQCAMHKESFEGLGYSCFNCHTKYCVKCAYTLAEKNIGCIVCGKLIPIVFQRKKSTKIKNQKLEGSQNILSNVNRIFEAENLIEEINKGDEINLTFFEKDFYEKIERLELDDTEKQAFLGEMHSLTPKERVNLISNIINKFKTSDFNKNYNYDLKSGLISLKLKKVFEGGNLLEEINQSDKIHLTFFEKDFYEKIERLELDETEKEAFLKDMIILTPKERNEIIKKLWRRSE